MDFLAMLAPKMAMSVCQLVGPSLWSRLKYLSITGWIALKLCTDINGPKRINLIVFSNLLTFPLAPQAAQSFHL